MNRTRSIAASVGVGLTLVLDSLLLGRHHVAGALGMGWTCRGSAVSRTDTQILLHVGCGYYDVGFFLGGLLLAGALALGLLSFARRNRTAAPSR